MKLLMISMMMALRTLPLRSNSEDVRRFSRGNRCDNQISDESTSGDSIDMALPDEDSSVNDPDELEEEAVSAQLLKDQNRKVMMSLKKKLVLRPHCIKDQNRKVLMS